MGLIEKVSSGLSGKLGDRLNKTEEEKAVLNYGLFMVIHTGLALVLTLIIGIITNMILEIMVISIVAALLKRYSGGVHSSTPMRCIITGIILSLALSIICRYVISEIDGYILFIIGLCSLLVSCYILYKKCPVGSKNKPFKKESSRIRIRKKSFGLMRIYIILIIILYFIYIIKNIYLAKVLIVSVTLGIMLQIFALTKVGARFIKGLEYIFEFIKVS